MFDIHSHWKKGGTSYIKLFNKNIELDLYLLYGHVATMGGFVVSILQSIFLLIRMVDDPLACVN